MTDGTIDFDVRGTPVPQGSARAFVFGRHAAVTHDNRNTTQWRHLVASVAQEHAPPELWTGPVRLCLSFRLDRPLSEPTMAGRGRKRHPIRTWPDRSPDLDKLVRAVGDALTGILFKNDAQVVEIVASKDWGPPGVRIVASRVFESAPLD